MILVCNDPAGVEVLLNTFVWPEDAPKANASSLLLNNSQRQLAIADKQRIASAKVMMASIALD